MVDYLTQIFVIISWHYLQHYLNVKHTIKRPVGLAARLSTCIIILLREYYILYNLWQAIDNKTVMKRCYDGNTAFNIFSWVYKIYGQFQKRETLCMKCDTVGATHKYNYMYIYRTIHDIGWERWGIKKI